MTDRPMRDCVECGQVDDHPRHVVSMIVEGRPTVTTRHLDCCAARGCESCAASEEQTAGARGSALVELLATSREA